ncbi:hypothetical protein PARPLA_01342 [Rhodobacteraceae bacterium THAF1]|uniref:hypothetical protein n=1 Tax=Palleronia sp. THAF1 TaxID=2587842 RepID=UPI000F40923A|nr:hypothetical protein FIU81_12390 [Palleronia sp. THAF1]VDC21845.1 hypothetical protein PARPLA_01342 [Rhodobacteraceae bacterium THAF1]
MTNTIATYDDLAAFQRSETTLKGPVAIVLVEDTVEVQSTLDHLVKLGFATLVVMARPSDVIELPDTVPTIRVGWRNDRVGAVPAAVNAVAENGPGLWMHYCFNAEYLFFPFCETRRVGEMLAFHTEERRFSMLTYVVDLYGADVGNAVDRDGAHLDASGYYASVRPDPENHNHPKERQLDFHGGLRWRFEEHVPAHRRRIDRIGLFRAKPGVALLDDHTFTEPEYNTYSCPWHNNLTAAICSFRAAKALTTNAGSRHDIDSFMWFRSEPFRWHSQQLLDLGLMEPGQWF